MWHAGNSLSCFQMCVYVREKQSQTITEKNLFLNFLFIYLFLAVLGLPSCVGLSVAVTSGCCSLLWFSGILLWRKYTSVGSYANVASFFFPILISEVLDIQVKRSQLAGPQHCPIILHSLWLYFPSSYDGIWPRTTLFCPDNSFIREHEGMNHSPKNFQVTEVCPLNPKLFLV